MADLEQYLVTLSTPKGDAVFEVPTFQGPEVAGRRAWAAAVHMRFGDVDEVRVKAIEKPQE
ncbi:hypothetical protein ACIBSW_34635 [Actinoplanes sp. NPDC049668]|uniref:hypothetical protein n=1 Tax=unclassified Actinoplanes TaxID=2626549 RepID=UPI0033B96758